LQPGQIIELLPDHLRPGELQRDVPFLLQEPVALLAGTTPADIDVLDAMRRGYHANLYRLHADPQGRLTVTFPDDTVLRGAGSAGFVSSAARSADGTTWIMDNPDLAVQGTPRVIRVPRSGQATVHATLAGLKLSRDRVRLTTLPDGRVGYLARGRPHALPGDTGALPQLAGVDRLVPANGGGYLAAGRSGPGSPLEILRVDATGTRTTLSVGPRVTADSLRKNLTQPLLVPDGPVVALAADGLGGAYVAVASTPVDDSLGVDPDTGSMLLHVTSDGTTSLLLDGKARSSSSCPDLAPRASLVDAERDLGRITDLVLRGDQLWIADAACNRVLALRLASS
jgi:hypothetical protein